MWHKDFRILDFLFYVNMYNEGFIFHNILSTAPQDICLSVKCKIPFVNCASKYSVYKVMSEEPVTRFGVPAGFIYFLWTLVFQKRAVEA